MFQRLAAASIVLCVACANEVATPTATSEQALGGSEFLTFDRRSGCCLDGDLGACSDYAGKSDVYVAPSTALPNGKYFFVTILPGQPATAVLDGWDGNLSDPVSGATPGDLGIGDFVEDRTFTLYDGRIVEYAGSHPFGVGPDGRRVIGLAPFDETSELDGKYVAAICRVDGSECWFDRFEIVVGATCAPAIGRQRRTR